MTEARGRKVAILLACTLAFPLAACRQDEPPRASPQAAPKDWKMERATSPIPPTPPSLKG
jgi:hypothetical protein